jgi:hypothetical protein
LPTGQILNAQPPSKGGETLLSSFSLIPQAYVDGYGAGGQKAQGNSAGQVTSDYYNFVK